MPTPSLPDPDKWLSAKKVERPPVQRPIVDARFRAHCGIATPPPSTSRKRAPAPPRSSSVSASGSTSKRALVTPTAPPRNSIASYFTPPTTGATQKNKGKEVVRPPAATPSAVEASPLVRDARRPSTTPTARYIPSQNFRVPLLTQGPPPSSSPQIPITQVPEDVLANHRKLCGDDTERPRALSPWRLDTGETDAAELAAKAREDRDDAKARRDEERTAKRKERDDYTHEVIGAQAVERARKAKERRLLGEVKSLAHLSSSTGSSSPSREECELSPTRGILAAQPSNIAPAPAPLRRHSSAVEQPERDSRFPPNKWQLPPIPSRRKTPQPPSPTTPRKRTPNHHKVTPPHSRTPQKYVGAQETLFILPQPPAQPVFSPVQGRPARQWQPVQADPETLITWSLGGGYTLPPVPEEAAGAEDADLDDNESIAGSVTSQAFPRLVESMSPLQGRMQQLSPAGAGKSLLEFNRGHSASPSSPSCMVSFFPYSPEAPAKQPSNDTIPSSLPEELPEEPEDDAEPARPSSPSPSPRKLVRRKDQQFKRVGLFSSISDAPPPEHPPASGAKSRSTSVSARSSQRTPHPGRTGPLKATQSRLEAFGYHSDKRRDEAADFAIPFSDEEDLDFGAEEPLFGSPSRTAGGRLQPVPEAPPHPSLRSVGVREVARRDEAAMQRHRSQTRKGTDNSTDKGKYRATQNKENMENKENKENKERDMEMGNRKRNDKHGQEPDHEMEDKEYQKEDLFETGSSQYELPHLSSDYELPPSTGTSTNASSSLGGLDMPRVSKSTREWWDKLGERDALGP